MPSPIPTIPELPQSRKGFEASPGLSSTDQRGSKHFGKRATYEIILLVALPFMVLSPLLSCEFLRWDDTETIARNTVLLRSPLRQIPHFFVEITADPSELYIPMTKTAWLLTAHIARLKHVAADGILFDPFYFHLLNLLVHAANTLLIYALLKRLTGRGWPSVAGALLFALHPLQVQSVGWVSGLKDLLAATGELAALNAFVILLQRREQGRSGALCYAIATLAFIAALFAKVSAVACPVLGLVLGVAIVGRQRSLRWVALPLAPWALLALPFVVESRHLQPMSAAPYVSPLLRPLIATDALAFYIGKLVLPIHLGFDYGRQPQVVLAGLAFWTWIVPAAVALGAISFGRRIPWLRTGLLLFAAALLPVLGLLPFQSQAISTVMDHYVYVGMFGIALAATGTCQLFTRSAAGQLSVGAILLGFACNSYAQTSYWQNSLTFFTHGLYENPRSFMSMGVLGELAKESGKRDVAERYFRQANQISSFRANLFDLGNLLLQEQRYPAAADTFSRLVSIWPDDAEGRNNLAVALLAMNEPSKAIVQLREAIRLNPTNANAESNLGRASLETGDRAAAVAHFQQALRISPGLPSAVRGLQQCGVQP